MVVDDHCTDLPGPFLDEDGGWSNEREGDWWA